MLALMHGVQRDAAVCVKYCGKVVGGTGRRGARSGALPPAAD